MSDLDDYTGIRVKRAVLFVIKKEEMILGKVGTYSKEEITDVVGYVDRDSDISEMKTVA